MLRKYTMVMPTHTFSELLVGYKAVNKAGIEFCFPRIKKLI